MIIRWHLQHGIVVIPKSVNPERIRVERRRRRLRPHRRRHGRARRARPELGPAAAAAPPRRRRRTGPRSARTRLGLDSGSIRKVPSVAFRPRTGDDGPHACRAVGHLRQRRDVPRHRQGGRDAAGRLGVDVDFPAAQTCCGQPMVNTGYLDEAVPVVRTLRRRVRGVRRGRDAVGIVRRLGPAPARDRRAPLGRPGPAAARRARPSPKVYELSEFLVDVLGVTDVGAYFPHTVTYHPTCHSLRMLGVGDRPRRLLEAVRGLDADRPAGGRGVLRLRRHLRGEERRHLGGDGRRQGAPRPRDRRRGAGRRRQLLPDAHRRDAVAPAVRRAGHAPRRDPGRDRGRSPRAWRTAVGA